MRSARSLNVKFPLLYFSQVIEFEFDTENTKTAKGFAELVAVSISVAFTLALFHHPGEIEISDNF